MQPCGLQERRLRRSLLPPGPVEQFDFCQAFANHGGKEKCKENATDQHVVVVVFQYVKLLGGIDACLVDVEAVCHHLEGKEMMKRGIEWMLKR